MENTEVLFRSIEALVAILGTVLIVIGWFVLYKQYFMKERYRRENDNKVEKIRWKKELIDKQIKGLYGPLRALIMEGDIMRSLLIHQLNREYVIPKDKSFYDLPENEQKIWKHYVDTYLIKRNMKMVEIMSDNTHLFHNSVFPTCYKEFLGYALGWELLDNQKRNDVPNFYEYHYKKNYPDEFSQYVIHTFDVLLSEQSKLIEESGKPFVNTSWE